MATLKDIAKKAGVTATTVSRVINNRGYVSEGTRKKVYAVMEEMNYQPNELARAFSRQHTNAIGVIVPHITHPFFAKLISNLETSAVAWNYKILLCNSKEQPKKEAEYLNMCVSNRVSGIILCSKYVKAEKFRPLDIPIVNLEREGSVDAITIQCDNYQGGKMAAEHLIQCGCKNLLHFGGVFGKDMPADLRANGFTDVCNEAGVRSIVLQSDGIVYDSMNYRDFIAQGIQENPQVDGIFASSDLIAAQVIQVCTSMGIQIPKQIKLVGFDNVMIASITTPTITTIDLPVKKMAEMSMEYISKSLKGEIVPVSITLPVSLIKRESTKIKENHQSK